MAKIVSDARRGYHVRGLRTSLAQSSDSADLCPTQTHTAQCTFLVVPAIIVHSNDVPASHSLGTPIMRPTVSKAVNQLDRKDMFIAPTHNAEVRIIVNDSPLPPHDKHTTSSSSSSGSASLGSLRLECNGPS